MANNNNTSPSNSAFYASGPGKWDSKRDNPNVKKNADDIPDSGMDLAEVIEFVTCAEVVITNATKSFNVAKNNKVMDVLIENITMINIQGNMMIINTIDMNPYAIVFKNDTELSKAENRIFTLMNGGVDPGCNP